jgi:2-methylisocitrate lyase-like PEP mutase family enzyme
MNHAAARTLRELLARPGKIVVAPGAYDAFGARLAERNGFEAVYLSGSLIAGSLGFADNGVVTLTEQTYAARVVARAVGIPVVADAESGFGDLDNLRRTVREYEDAGVAGLHLEDQRPGGPKAAHVYIATGAPAGGAFFTIEEMARNVEAAVAARRNPDTVINARTDALAAEGMAPAIERANAYAAAGADLVFVQQPRTADEVAALVRGVKAGLMLSNTLLDAAGVTSGDLERLGVKLVMGGQAHRIAMQAADAALAAFKATGTFARAR